MPAQPRTPGAVREVPRVVQAARDRFPGQVAAGAVRVFGAALCLVLAACAAPPPEPPPTDPACAAYAQYGELAGTRVSVTVPRPEGYVAASEQFATCTGVELTYGTAPGSDLAVLDRAQLVAAARSGSARPVPPTVAADVDRSFPATLKAAGSIDGTLYAAPLGVEVLSLVGYPPGVGTDRDPGAPGSWAELVALVERVAAGGAVAWCAGDPGALLQDVLVRELGADGYDAWVAHDVPADTAPAVAALDRAGGLLRNPAYRAGAGECVLHHRPGRDAGAAFQLPPLTAGTPAPVLVSAEFAVAVSDRQEVQAVQAYLASPEWADAMAAATPGWVGANGGLDPAIVTGPVAQLSVRLLQDPATIVRFDGAQLMPVEIGAGSWPAAVTGWLAGGSSAEALAAVERAWPAG